MKFNKLTHACIVLFLMTICLSCKDKKNPRKMNGRTTLVTEDSVYFISFRIDSVIVMDYDQEDPHR